MATIHTLHIVNKRPDHPAFGACLSSITDQDGLLLTESGVLALADREAVLKGAIYALAPDLQARGITAEGLDVETIDFDTMVALATEAARVISW
jgi:tRNA 2-thiouridine synthesizing protein B